MSESNYEDLLSQSWDEIPEPQVLPEGSYLLKGRNASYLPAKSETNSPQVLFVYQVKEPMDDVDTEQLDALGADYDINENKVFFRIYVDDAAGWDTVRKHLAKHDVDTKGKSISDSLKAFKGTEVIAFLSKNNYTDKAGETQTQNVATAFVKVE